MWRRCRARRHRDQGSRREVHTRPLPRTAPPQPGATGAATGARRGRPSSARASPSGRPDWRAREEPSRPSRLEHGRRRARGDDVPRGQGARAGRLAAAAQDVGEEAGRVVERGRGQWRGRGRGCATTTVPAQDPVRRGRLGGGVRVQHASRRAEPPAQRRGLAWLEPPAQRRELARLEPAAQRRELARLAFAAQRQRLGLAQRLGLVLAARRQSRERGLGAFYAGQPGQRHWQQPHEPLLGAQRVRARPGAGGAAGIPQRAFHAAPDERRHPNRRPWRAGQRRGCVRG